MTRLPTDDDRPTLARYAVRAETSRGRVHAEPADELRDPFEVDRHRILTCSAFRRVRSKTQVFGSGDDDHFRTRMTHTLEVAEIARLLARGLRVNETLAQVIALVHDLGHAPFGHAGEAALNDCMRRHGGFEHNAQTLRVVDYLEHPYPGFRGLNLTYEVREGIVKHASVFDRPAPFSTDPAAAALLESGPFATVEAQVVNLADRLAYDLHDMEDAIGAGMLTEKQLETLPLWRKARERCRGLPAQANLFAIRRPVLDAMLDHVVRDAAGESLSRLDSRDHPDAVRRLEVAAVRVSNAVQEELRQLEDLLLRDVYRTPWIERLDHEARTVVTELFERYLASPEELPSRFRSRVEKLGHHRTICDYIAGMTDRYCRAEWERLTSKAVRG